MRGENTGQRFRYAGDVGVLGVGKSIADSTEAALREVNNLVGWAQHNVVKFDVAKSEAVQLHG